MNKTALSTLFESYGLDVDAPAAAAIERMIEGWDKIRPIEITALPDAQGHRLSFVHEHHYTEKVGKKSCNGRRRGVSCNETYPGIDQDFMDLLSYRVELTPEGVRAAKAVTKKSQIINPNQFSNNDKYPLALQFKQYLTSTHCTKAVKTLTDSIYDTLHAFGLTTDSEITDPTKQKSFKSALNQLLGKAEKRRRLYALRDFASHLKADILSAMEMAGRDDMKALNWLYADGDETKQKYRTQAVQAYPLLFPVFLGERMNALRQNNQPPSISEWHLRDYSEGRQQEIRADHDRIIAENETLEANTAELQRRIDNAEPIAEILAKCILVKQPISKRLLKTLGRIKAVPSPLQKTTQYNSYDYFLTKALPLLEELDSSWHPKNKNELRDCLECLKRADKLQEVLGTPVAETIYNIRGKWSEWCKKTVSVQAIQDINDWKQEVYKTVLLPQIIKQLPQDIAELLGDNERLRDHYYDKSTTRYRYTYDLAKDLLMTEQDNLLNAFLADHSPLDILECSIRWHEQGEAYRTAKQSLGIAHIDELNDWAPLTEPLKAPNGLWLVPLSSRQDLDDESKAMHHCVGWGGYDAGCLTGHDHIVSVSNSPDKNDLEEKRSTVQLREVFNKKKDEVTSLENKQHQGRGGVRDEDRTAIKWYLRELFHQSGLNAPDWETIESVRKENRAMDVKKGYANLIGLDARDEDVRFKAFEAIKAFLPSRYRTIEYPAFSETLSQIEPFTLEKTALYKKLIEDKVIKFRKQEEPAQANDNRGGVLNWTARMLGLS